MSIMKADVAAFYEDFFNQHQVDAADKIIANEYIQHNKGITNGRTALKEAFKKRFESAEFFHLAVDQILIDGDYIAVFIRNVDEDGKTKFSVIDLYRVENNKFVEHWDYFDHQAKG